MKRRFVVLGALALILFAAAALVFRRSRPIDVVLITVDTLRADRLHCFGHPTNRTPNIDALAAAGVRFAAAFCDVTWTTPSMSSVMTGTYATRHGMRSTYQQLDPANVTLAETLKAQGYTTAAIIGSFPLDHTFGLNKGFDSYDDHFTTPVMIGGDAPGQHVESKFSGDVDEQRLYQYLKAQADAYRPDNEVTDAAIAWLQGKRREPFFVWVHYFGPHEVGDMRLNLEESDRQTIAAYDHDVERADREVGRLLAELDGLGLGGRTLVILHADHGQSLGEHLYVGHGKNLYDPTLRVPLIMRLPRVVPAGKVVSELARNVDIMPTVLELAGLHVPEGLDGASLHALWSQDRSPEREVYSETYLPATEAFAQEVPDGHGGILRVGFRRRGVRTAQWKFVVNEPWPFLDYATPPALPEDVVKGLYSEELYDVKQNPLELRRALVKDRPDIEEQMRKKLAAYTALPGHGGAHRELDEAAKERLRSLGYMK